MSSKWMTSAWAAPVDHPHARLLLLAMADIADDAGHCHPTISALASRTRLSTPMVGRHLRALETSGFIRQQLASGGWQMVL